MENEPKTIEERLKEKHILPTTRFHNYEYLYKSIVEIMQQYEKERNNLTKQNNLDQ